MSLTRVGSQEPSLEVCLTQKTFEERLREEKVRIEKRLANINFVLEKLEKDSQMAEMIEALQKLGY